jgi:hypothetical protein
MGKLITQVEAAKLRGVTVSAISYLLRRGRIRGVEKFGRVLVYEDEVRKYESMKAGRPRATKRAGNKTKAKK